jgi:hypothetical protein
MGFGLARPTLRLPRLDRFTAARSRSVLRLCPMRVRAMLWIGKLLRRRTMLWTRILLRVRPLLWTGLLRTGLLRTGAIRWTGPLLRIGPVLRAGPLLCARPVLRIGTMLWIGFLRLRAVWCNGMSLCGSRLPLAIEAALRLPGGGVWLRMRAGVLLPAPHDAVWRSSLLWDLHLGMGPTLRRHLRITL